MRPTNLIDVPFLRSDAGILTQLSQLPIGTPRLVIDLGCGDGFVLEQFKKAFDCELIGYELHTGRAAEARALLPEATILEENFWEADVSKADVVYTFWLDTMMEGFMEVHWPQMKSGAWLISHQSPIPKIEPTYRLGSLYLYQK